MTPVGPITPYQPVYADMGHSLLPFLHCKMCRVLTEYVKTNTFVLLLNLLFGFILIVRGPGGSMS